jgi:hypothetical protein
VGARGAQGVSAHRLGEHVDAREGLRVLLDVVRDALGNVGGDRDRAEDVVAGVVQPRPELVRGDVEEPRQVEQDALGLVPELLPVDRDHHAPAVLDQERAVRVLDHPARRGHLDQAHGVVLGLRLVLLGGEHLQEPEPGRERGEHREHERGQDLHAQAHPGLGHALTGPSPSGDAM